MADVRSIINGKMVANTPQIITSAGDVLAANLERGAWMIQNTGTNPIFVRLGTGASSTVFHYVLKGGSGNEDGLGASIAQEMGTVYTGVISIAGTSPRCVVTEI